MTISANYHGVVNCQASTNHIIQREPRGRKATNPLPIGLGTRCFWGMGWEWEWGWDRVKEKLWQTKIDWYINDKWFIYWFHERSCQKINNLNCEKLSKKKYNLNTEYMYRICLCSCLVVDLWLLGWVWRISFIIYNWFLKKKSLKYAKYNCSWDEKILFRNNLIYQVI